MNYGKSIIIFNQCYCLVRHCDSSCTSASNLNFSSLKRYLSTRVIIWFIFVLFLPLPCSFFASLLLLVDLLLLLFLLLLCKCCLNNYMVLFMFFWDRNQIWFSLVSIFKTHSQSLPTVFVWQACLLFTMFYTVLTQTCGHC